LIGGLKRRWWLGLSVAGFTIAAIATVQAIITIASAFIHAASIKPLTLQEPRLDPPPSFEERWQTAFSINWQRPPTAVSMHE
jgi:hypothetical protein